MSAGGIFDIDIKLSDDVTRTRTFSIYQTQYDMETISVDLGDDNLLIPCADGTTPDKGIFPIDIPVIMRYAGEPVNITSVKSTDSGFTDFEFKNDTLSLKGLPSNNKSHGSIGFTFSGEGKTGTAYVSYTKFDTKGGTISMYTLLLNANDIVCDTRNNINEYKVYSGKLGNQDNYIIAKVKEYANGKFVEKKVSDLKNNYAVFYANDPQDWVEGSEENEYQKINDSGILIGTGGICPDNCVPKGTSIRILKTNPFLFDFIVIFFTLILLSNSKTQCITI